MKAITLWEPWASAIACGLKHYETRSWVTGYRGLIAIHASKRWTRSEQVYLSRFRNAFPHEFAGFPEKPPLGSVVAACRITGIYRVEEIRGELSPLELALGNYADGRFAWKLEVVKIPPEPIPASGKQGIWEWVPEDVR